MRRIDPSVENEDFPKWMYGPDGATMLVQSPAEIPPRFVAHPSLVREDGEEPVKTDTPPLTRQQIIEALKERKVSFKQTSATPTLYEQLVAAVEASGEA